MAIEVLIKELEIKENGTNLKSCPAVFKVSLMPPGGVQELYPKGREIKLKDKYKKKFGSKQGGSPAIEVSNYKDQLQVRGSITGKSWVEVGVISSSDYGFMKDIIKAAFKRAKDIVNVSAIPFGETLFSLLEKQIDKDSIKPIGFGQSNLFKLSDLPLDMEIELSAVSDIRGEIFSGPDDFLNPSSNIDGGRPVLLKKGEKNGRVKIRIEEV